MNAFKKLRFPKTSLALFITGMLVLFAIPVRIMLGEPFNLPSNKAGVQKALFPEWIFPILVIGLSFLLLSLLLWLLLRKKGVCFMDISWPLSTLSATAIFVYFHFIIIG